MSSKKLLGVYLSEQIIARLKKYISRVFLHENKKLTESGVVEEALTEYLDKKEPPSN